MKSATAVLVPFVHKFGGPLGNVKDSELPAFMKNFGLSVATPRDKFEEKLKELFQSKSNWDTNQNRRIRLVIQSQFWDALSDNESATAQKLWPTILYSLNLRGDWYELMMSLTEGDFDLVDALFLALGNGRRPASDHVFLAQLADVFRVRLYLSLNFDPLLETALWDEGHPPNVIEVAKDADLPSREVVGDRLTVLKLHGGAYGVRIGERIQVSADSNTQARAMKLIPKDALILVMGFSGYERRMTQLLVEHCHRRCSETQLLWMNFGEEPDKPLKKILERFKDVDRPIAWRKYNGVSSFLLNVLVRAHGAHPAGQRPYPALPTKPWAEPTITNEEKPIVAFFRDSDWETAHLSADHDDASVAMAGFCAAKAKSHHIIWIDCEQHHTVDGVVSEILDTIYQYDPKFQPLLMQSVGGQKTDYYRPIERIREALQRGYYVLAIDSPETIGRPQTVHHGTTSLELPENQQARPETIRRPHTVQHGTTSLEPQENQKARLEFEQRVEKFNARVDGFFTFLTNLMTQQGSKEEALPLAMDIGGSYICVAFAPPSPRRPGSENSKTLNHVHEKMDLFRNAIKGATNFVRTENCAIQQIQMNDRQINFHQLINKLFTPSEKLDQVESYAILTVFRRPRSHLAYYALLRSPALWSNESKTTQCSSETWNELFGSAELNKKLEGSFKYECGVTRLDGGLLWLPRFQRNLEYFKLTEPGQQVAKQLLINPKTSPSRNSISDAILSLLATAILHRRAARYYFSDVYEATGDIVAFREYIYHRVSYLRTLCRLMGVSAYGSNISSIQKELKTRKLVAWAVSHYSYPDESPLGKLSGGQNDAPSWDRIRAEVRRAWREELGAFHATLSREFYAVLRKLYAGTWISLTDRLLEIDVREMFDKQFFVLEGEEETASEVRLCDDEIKSLGDELRFQQLKARFEMADWAGLLDDPKLMDVEEILKSGNDFLVKDIKSILLKTKETRDRTQSSPDVKRAISINPQRMPAKFVERFIKLLDLSVEWLRRAEIYHELACPVEGDDEATSLQLDYISKSDKVSSRLTNWLDAVELEGVTRKSRMPPFSKEIKRLLHDRLAQHRLDILGTIARFGFNRFNALDPEQKMLTLNTVRENAIRLFERTRKTIFNDGATYNYFRAKSLRMVARCDYLNEDEQRRFSKPIAHLNLALRLLYRHGSPDALEVLSCYRTKAEAYMLWAKELIKTKNYLVAWHRLSSARSTIDKCEQTFDRRRRNVSWWLRLCHIRAQWAVLSCRLRVTDWKSEATPSPSFEADLRYGLDAIRAGFDGLLPIQELDPTTNANATLIWKSTKWQWSRFAKLWVELAEAAEEMAKKGIPHDWEAASRAARLPVLWACWTGAREGFVETLFNRFLELRKHDPHGLGSGN